jgi:hypothetical protein
VALFFEVPLNKELPSSAKNDKDNAFKVIIYLFFSLLILLILSKIRDIMKIS